jgi:hypothetical protein
MDYHDRMEKSLLEIGKIVVDNVELPIFPSTVENGIKIGENLKLEAGVYLELLIWLDSAKLAGQADYVEIIDGVVNIKDHKTNKELKTKGFVNWEGKEEMLLYPVSHLPCCNFSIYSLQLNMYMYIILRHNPKLKMGKMSLLHVKFDEAGEVDCVTEFEVPNMQSEVKTIIELHKQNKL